MVLRVAISESIHRLHGQCVEICNNRCESSGEGSSSVYFDEVIDKGPGGVDAKTNSVFYCECNGALGVVGRRGTVPDLETERILIDCVKALVERIGVACHAQLRIDTVVGVHIPLGRSFALEDGRFGYVMD